MGLLLLTVTDVSTTCAVVIFRLFLTLKMTAAQVVETSVSVNNNSPIKDFVHPDDQTQPTIYFVTLARFFVILIYPHSLFSYFCF